MITYTEEQVKELIQENLYLKKENAEMQEYVNQCNNHVDEVELEYKNLKKAYTDMAMRCIDMYISKKSVEVDTIEVKVIVPRFMSQDDLSYGLLESIKNSILCERDKHLIGNSFQM